MKKKVFYSFHFDNDHWRAGQVRNIGFVEGNQPVSQNDWEQVKRGKDRAIQNWIDEQLKYKQCTVVLVGEQTHLRPWVQYEIKKTWEDGKGVVGIHVHKLKCHQGQQSNRGNNPFDRFTLNGGRKMSSVVPLHDVPYTASNDAYSYISQNIANWVDEAIRIRNG